MKKRVNETGSSIGLVSAIAKFDVQVQFVRIHMNNHCERWATRTCHKNSKIWRSQRAANSEPRAVQSIARNSSTFLRHKVGTSGLFGVLAEHMFPAHTLLRKGKLLGVLCVVFGLSLWCLNCSVDQLRDLEKLLTTMSFM